MGLFAIESLDGSRPVSTVSALDGLAGVFRVDGLKLRVRIIVWWTRHVEEGVCWSVIML